MLGSEITWIDWMAATLLIAGALAAVVTAFHRLLGGRSKGL
jgi:hypothetical protein